MAYAPTEVNGSYQPMASFYINAVSYCLKLLPMIVTMWAAWHYQLPLTDYIAYCAVLAIVCSAVDQPQASSVPRAAARVRLCD